MNFRSIVTVAAATALATALVAPAQAAESTKKTPAQGSLSLDMGPSVFADLKREGLSF